MRPDTVHLDLLAPCLREIGDRWAAGSLSVGGEHVAVRVAARLAPLCARRGRTRGTVMIGGSAGVLHGLLITLITNVLRSRGWEVLELGPNTTVADLMEAPQAARRRPGVPDATVARRLVADGWAPDADQLDALLSDSG